jgi:hypothetical protein
LEADEKLRKTLYEIHKGLMDMLFIRKTISMSLFDSDIQDDNERIRSIFADALPQYPIAEWKIELLKDVFERFRIDALQQKLQNEAEAKEEAEKEAEKRQQKELIEAQRAADKKQLMEAYVAFQEKQKSQGREAAILEHKSKFEPKPRPFGEAVREGVGDCTEPKAASPPLFRPIKKAVGTRGRMSDCLIAHSRNNMDQTRHSGPYFESPATNVDGLNLQCGGGAFERPQNAEKGDSGKGLSEMNSAEKLRTRRLALENNFPPLSGLSPDVSKSVKIPKPAKTTADAIRLQ